MTGVTEAKILKQSSMWCDQQLLDSLREHARYDALKCCSHIAKPGQITRYPLPVPELPGSEPEVSNPKF